MPKFKKGINILLSTVLFLSMMVQFVEGANQKFEGLESSELQSVASEYANVLFRPNDGPTSEISLSVPGSIFLGSDFDLTVVFDNNGFSIPGDYGSTGFGPFIDLVIPRGDGTNAISPPAGGYSASYGSEDLEIIVNTFPDSGDGTGCVLHPWAIDASGFSTQVCGIAGDDLLSIKLPFGSYTISQPAISISVPLYLEAQAALNLPQEINGRGGYIYGATPTIDFCCTTPPDTTIVSHGSDTTTWIDEAITPALITMNKSSSDGETATGENYDQTYTINLNMAPGQEFTDFILVDDLPDNIVFLGDIQISPALYGSAIDSITYDDTTDAIDPVLLNLGQSVIDNGPKKNSQLVFEFDSSTRISGGLSITFDYYIPEFDSGDGFVSPVSTNGDSENNVVQMTQGTWWPLSDPSDPADSVDLIGEGIGPSSASTPTVGEDVTMSKSSNLNSITPGDVIRFTVSFEVSDYFGIDDVVINDTLPDGLRYYENLGSGQVPVFVLNRNGASESYSMDANNIDWVCNYTGAQILDTFCDSVGGFLDGTTDIAFKLSDQVYETTVDPTPTNSNDDEKVFASQFLGGDIQIADPHTYREATTGTLTYYAQVLDRYTDSHNLEQIKMGDGFTNSAQLDSVWVDADSCLTIPCTTLSTPATYGGSASVGVPHGSTSKTIVGFKDSLCNSGSYAACSDVEIAAGDTVTYRLKYTVPSGDFHELSFTDFLPLPIFYADDPNATGSITTPAGDAWSYDADLADVLSTGGLWQYGPEHSAEYEAAVTPVVSATSSDTDNTLLFDFTDFDDPSNSAKTIDVIFTVRVNSKKFADQLMLRNSVLQQDANSTSYNPEEVVKADLTLTEPILVGSKTVIATDSTKAVLEDGPDAPIVFNDAGTTGLPWTPSTTPISTDYLGDGNTAIDSSFSGLDGGDLVRFAIVINNIGTGVNGAFDIKIQDVKPDSLIIPPGGINLTITRGDGVDFSNAINPMGPNNNENDLFENGIEILDPGQITPPDAAYGEGGACQGHDGANGKSVLLVTYDLMIDPEIAAGTEITNNGKIIGYAGEEGGEDYTEDEGDEEDEGSVTVDEPTISKEIIWSEYNDALDLDIDGTSFLDINGNGLKEATIGEYVKYRIEITVPETKSDNMVLTDTLARGLYFVEFDNSSFELIDSGSPANTLIGVLVDENGADVVAPTPTISMNGNNQEIKWDFGTIENNDSDNSVDEKIVFEYTVMVNDWINNNFGDIRSNSAVMSWNLADGSSEESEAGSDSVRIVEPQVNISKSVSPTTAQAGAPLTYTIELNTRTNSNDTDAYEVTFSDPIPTCDNGESFLVINDPATDYTVVDDAGIVNTSNFELDGSNATGWTLQTVSGFSFDMPLDNSRTITMTVTGNVSYCVNPEFEYPNRATVSYSSMNGELSNRDYNTSSSGLDKERDYTNQSSATSAVLIVDEPVLTKSIYSTNNGYSDDGELAIGETVTYQLAFTIPQGTSTGVTVSDAVPAGLEYVADSALLWLDADSAMTVDADLNSANGLSVSGTGASILDATLVGVNGADEQAFVSTSGTVNAGQTVMVYLGDIVNNDEPVSGTTTENETIMIRFDAVVKNLETVNSIGQVKANNFNTEISGETNTSNTVRSTIVEPDLNLEKTNALVNSVCEDLRDASGATFNNCIGSTHSYTIKVTNPETFLDPVLGVQPTNSYVAWETVVTDLVPIGMTLDQSTLKAELIDNTMPGGTRTELDTLGTVGSQWTINYEITGNPVTEQKITLTAAPGTSIGVSDDVWIEITYEATIDYNASAVGVEPVVNNVPQPDDDLVNNVKVDWSNIEGPSDDKRIYTESTSSTVTVENGDLVIDKYDAYDEINLITGANLLSEDHTFAEGTKIYYGINIINVGNVPTEFSLSDLLPANTSYDAAETDRVNSLLTGLSLTDTWNTVDNSTYTAVPRTNAGIGVLEESGATDLVSGDPTDRAKWYFVVVIDDPLQAGETRAVNTATALMDATTGGFDPKPGDNRDTQGDDILGEPVLNIEKTDNKHTTTLGDTIVYTISYQNIGGQDATGVVLTETVPAGTTWFDDTAVTTDDGWVCTPDGSAGNTCEWNVGDLAASDTVTHTVTFAVLVDNVTSVLTIDNTVSVEDDGLNNTTGTDPQTDSDGDEDILIQSMSKTLTRITEPAATAFDPSGNDIAIGAILTYQIEIEIPSTSTGNDDIVVPNFVLTDVLDQGLAFVGCGVGDGTTGVTATGNLTTSNAGGFDVICDRATDALPTSTIGTSPTVSAYPPGDTEALNQGRSLTFDFGDITNDNESSATQTITIIYRVVALNDASVVVNSGERNNHIEVTWDDVNSSLTSEAQSVEIVEPFLDIEKNVASTIVDIGGAAIYTLTIFHEPESTTSAFDVNVFDTIPDGLEYVDNSAVHRNGEVPDSITYDSATRLLTISYDEWDPNGNMQSVIEFRAVVVYYPSGSIVNEANVEWTSLPGDFEGVQQSPFNSLSNERYYDPLDAVNLYGAEASVAIMPSILLPKTGFAPNETTKLSLQPVDKAYFEVDNMILEIPSLRVKSEIVGVPKYKNTWDVSWLNDKIAYLTGSAFPTQAGKTLLTGHVVDSQGNPSVFANLKDLSWGDEFVIHAHGLEYVYQVRSNERIKPNNQSVYESSGYDEVTLITCQGYNEETGNYEWRVAVSGVLVRVQK